MANTSPATCQCLATFTPLKSKILIFFRDYLGDVQSYIYRPTFRVIVIRHLTTLTLVYSCTLFQVLIIIMYTTNDVV